MEILSYLFSIENIAFIVPLAGYGTDFYAVSVVELWSTILGLASVIGARLNKVWWYSVGILNSLGFIAIFYQIQLYSDLLLNIYFIIISFYGWYIWTRKVHNHYVYPISYMSLNANVLWAAGILLSTFLVGLNINEIFGFLANNVANLLGVEYTHIPASFPILDSFIMVSSIAAMYLLAKRKVESWVLWVIIDVVCTGLYFYKGVIAMSAEYLIFLTNAIFGLYQWHVASKIKG